MKLVIQRVSAARVTVKEEVIAEIGLGFVVLVGFSIQDTIDSVNSPFWGWLAEKLVGLRIFSDSNSKMSKDISEIGGSILLVPQFTLYADCRRGRRPSFHNAAVPDVARYLFSNFSTKVSLLFPGKVEQGIFGADMNVSLTNCGPVTILLDSEMYTG